MELRVCLVGRIEGGIMEITGGGRKWADEEGLDIPSYTRNLILSTPPKLEERLEFNI